MAIVSKRQVIFRVFTLLGGLAVAIGLILWSLESAYQESGAFLLIIGILVIALVFITAPILDPRSPRGTARKKRLAESALSKFARKKDAYVICYVFENYIRHWPETIRHSPASVPASVQSITQTDNTITVRYNSKEYVFQFDEWQEGSSEHTGLPHKHARLEVYKNKRKRLTLTMQQIIGSKYQASWQPEQVEYLDLGFGTWIMDLKKIIKDARENERMLGKMKR